MPNLKPDTLSKIVSLPGGNWRDYITLETHSEFGEFAYVNGGAAEGDTLFE